MQGCGISGASAPDKPQPRIKKSIQYIFCPIQKQAMQANLVKRNLLYQGSKYPVARWPMASKITSHTN